MSRNLDNKLTCVIDRFENSYAVLLFNLSGKTQTLNLPKRFLPKEVKSQDVLHVKLLTNKQATMQQKQMAQNILDEILNNSK